MKDKSWKAFCKEMPGSHSFHGFLQLFGNLPCSYLHFSFWAEGPIDSPWQSLESMAKKKHFQILLQYLCNEPLSVVEAIVDRIYGYKSLFCNMFFDQKHGEKKTSKSYCNIFAMNHWMFLKRLWTEFMDTNLCFATCCSTKNMVKKNFWISLQ